MKLSEVIAELEKDPKGTYISNNSNTIFEIKVDGDCYRISGINDVIINVNKTFKKVEQPVTWYEAMRAWLKGATIRMEKNGGKFEVCHTEFVSRGGVDFNCDDFERGKWFIEAKS